MDKEATEKVVFQKFCEVVGWPNEDDRITNRQPPEPDILYHHPVDGPLAFELTEICSEEVAAAITKSRSTGVEFTRASDPSRLILSKKLKKHYSSTHPIELLCYTAGRTISPDNLIIGNVKDLIDAHTVNFRRIWIWGEHNIWHFRNGSILKYCAA